MSKIYAFPILGLCIFGTVYLYSFFGSADKFLEDITALGIRRELGYCENFTDVFGIAENDERAEARSDSEWGKFAIFPAKAY